MKDKDILNLFITNKLIQTCEPYSVVRGFRSWWGLLCSSLGIGMWDSSWFARVFSDGCSKGEVKRRGDTKPSETPLDDEPERCAPVPFAEAGVTKRISNS